jgi:ferric-dicitrate binding protein FerR (iron transport regulator)
MSDPRQQLPGPSNDDPMARLLRLAGPRPEVPAERAARVRDIVREQWQVGIRERRRRQLRIMTAAVLAAAAVTLLVVRPRSPVPRPAVLAGATMATVERTEGSPQLMRSTAQPPSAALLPTETLRAGDWVETGATARVALRLDDGTSIRIDSDSRVRMMAPALIDLTQGALYVATAEGTTGLEVRTPLGNARDIGTDFEVRLEPASLRLRVRSGIVELRRGERATSARASDELTATTDRVTRRTVATSGPEWGWVTALAPTLEIDGRPLATFLTQLCREQGWRLRYADDALARDASGIVLHGSVKGLQPEEALGIALTTSGLAHRLEHGTLLVFKPSGAR